MTILVRESSEGRVSIASNSFEGSDGRLWMPSNDDVSLLTEGWEEIVGCAGAMPSDYRLVSPSMILYDDPFCAYCSQRVCECEV